MAENIKQKPTFGYSLTLIVSIVVLVMVGMIGFGASIITMFLLSWLIVIPASMRLGYKNSELEEFAYDVGKDAFQSNIIILSVGVLIGAWIACGTIPSIVYGGLKIITPKYFLLTTLLLCSLTSLATGTSWGTLGTAGLAMISIGSSLGVPAGLTAGAIISGAFFGDKMSPLSDSTNLAPAVCGGELISHIKHMIYTTGPAYIISAVLYTVIGFKYADKTIDYNQINQVLGILDSNFKIGFVEFIPIIFLFILLLMQKPAIVSILSSAVVGCVLAVFRQGEAVSDILNYLLSGYSIDTGMVYANKLLNRGGIMSMAETVLLVFIVFLIAGILQKVGFLEALLTPMIERIGNSRTKLVGCTFIVSYFTNAFSSSMMFTSVLVGTLMTPLYKEFRLKPENLSRIIEDTATLGAPLIPWNSNAIFASQTLGVSPYEFIPYCFLNWITPIISLFYGATGITMTTFDEELEVQNTSACCLENNE
ncbi:Na+/H+ antiporter NhaC [Tepidibacter aestuarii]|uniref:Na+/H+ antiporter NhaC n=1 Tax=Tepidibacter aestuarii TaxID=2925782 RepID=UPI0020BDBB12|nr:Na+/H+ antiporter NhaC [Tepidibacter aestuarii]CAH2214587.1 Na+:H+ antiporter, NhaC family [Tepidibacter aestuarii]